jgi:hypothetical protein
MRKLDVTNPNEVERDLIDPLSNLGGPPWHTRHAW